MFIRKKERRESFSTLWGLFFSSSSSWRPFWLVSYVIQSSPFPLSSLFLFDFYLPLPLRYSCVRICKRGTTLLPTSHSAAFGWKFPDIFTFSGERKRNVFLRTVLQVASKQKICCILPSAFSKVSPHDRQRHESNDSEKRQKFIIVLQMAGQLSAWSAFSHFPHFCFS